MKNAPLPPKKKLSSAPYVLGLLLIVILVAAGIYEWHSRNQSGSSSAASDTTEYKATKYGFKFDYPKKWGSPEVISHLKQYQVSFAPMDGVKSNNQISIIFGASTEALSKKDVQQTLSSNKSKYIRHDSSSFAALRTDPENGTSSELSIYQIVDLSKIGVSAVSLNWTKLGSSKCSVDKFSESTGCMSTADYEAANKTAKSIIAL